MEWLRSYRPDLVERYEELYARGAYLPRVEQERIRALDPRARTATRAPRFGAFRREPGRDYEPTSRRIRPERPAAATGAGADQALLIGGGAWALCDHRHSLARYRPGRVVLSLYVTVHHDAPDRSMKRAVRHPKPLLA
jgi:hypothetical protein